jgi:Zn-finger nucleic acid-binding protein
MNKLSIAIDMGAKNNGVFIAKTQNSQILDKKATCIIVDEKKINFSKKSRRENRHKDRNYKRRKLAKRLLKEIIDFDAYTLKEQELILGLLNNRGYTLISTSTEFEKLNDETVEFINQYFEDLKDLVTKENFENKISSFENLQDLKEFIETINDKISIETKKKKNEFYKEFQSSFSNFIKKDLNQVKSLFNDVLKELDTGSKPRKKYLQEIEEEIKGFKFIDDKKSFFNFLGNISNLQLRVLRKYFNNKFDNKLDISKLDDKVRKYFKAFHYKTDKEKAQREELFKAFDCHDNILDFLKSTNPSLTIPPYEDMNNRDTYKCNSMLIKPELITDEIKNAIEYVLKDFDLLTIDQNGELKKEELHKIKVIKNNQKIKIDYTYSKYIQRILDAKKDITTKELNPRNVFKYENIDSIVCFQKAFGKDVYNTLKPIAKRYYEEESLIYGGIYEESNSIFVKCNVNTPYKNNAKHILLKPLYSYNFSNDEVDIFIKHIENKKIDSRSGLKGALELISVEAKKYQNGFYSVVTSCYENDKCIADEDIKKIVTNLPKIFKSIKEILKEQDINHSYFDTIEKLYSSNITRVLNIAKQTYEILFKDLGGFNKTCKHCTSENSIRSDEKQTIAKRLLSDVAKPIDGMLDMMLDRLSFEIVQNITSDDISDIDNLEILLEQNRFEFEDGLIAIKKKNKLDDKALKKRENHEKLNINTCPYNGKEFSKGDWDHILPQSQGVYNSKANMIYCSTKGNRDKNNQNYTLENLSPKHLEKIFKTENLEEIKEIIKKGINNVNKNDFTNFDNLTLHQQVALRYALFMRNTPEFDKAFELVKSDKIKTITNGTQKRLARFVYEKLTKKFPKEFETIKVNSKTVDNKLVSSTRNMLSVDNHNLKKQEIQDSHSHCIDAMVVYHLENDDIGFDEVYVEESSINNLSKNKTFINSPKKELGAYKLFDDTIYSENYKHIIYNILKQNEFEKLIEYQLLYKNIKNKKVYITSYSEIEENITYKIDVQKTSNTIYDLFISKNKSELSNLKFTDKLRYFTSRKEIQNIFFNEKQTELLSFDRVKNIPPYSDNLYKAVYKKLQNKPNLFNISEDGKSTLNSNALEDLLKNMFESKQKEENKQKRKRDKKRHKYTLPITGAPKFRIKRDNHWQILGNKDIATKNYIINGEIKPIPFFTKNTIPLKVSDMMDCLLVDENTPSVYEVDININEIKEHISKLKYIITEAKRCTLEVEFIKSSFINFDFNNIVLFDGAKDDMFQLFLKDYIENKDLVLNRYIGSIRDGLKGKSIVLDNNSQFITLQYKAGINKDKKQIILDNLKD